MFEGVLSGSDTGFHAGVQARLKKWEFGIKAFAQSENLEFTATGLGLTPKTGDALFAWSIDDIAQKYDTTGNAVPIFVEYRGIPGAVIDRKSIPWLHAYRVEFRFKTFTVLNDGAWFFSPSWNAMATCRKNGREVGADKMWVMPPQTKVSSGGAYEITWSHTFDGLGPIDVVACGVKGSYATNGGVYTLQETLSSDIVPRSTPLNQSVSGKMVGKTANSGYMVDYTVLVSEAL
jgi:hypothetical protein